MFVFGQTNQFGLISVLELDWEQSHANVSPRPYHALSIRLQGDAVFSDASHTEQLKTDDLLYMPADTAYTLHSGREKLIVIHFAMSDNFEKSFAVFRTESAAVLRELFQKILRIWNEKKPGYFYRAMSVFYKILGELAARYDAEAHDRSYQRIRTAADHIHRNFKDPELSVAQLCILANMSDTMFRRYFRKIYQTTPLQYINMLRTDHAEELLREGIYTVEQVALKSGFTDPKYFSTVFKSYKGNPPSFFKK